MSIGEENNNEGPVVMSLNDTDKYVREVSSKALLSTDINAAREYEQRRAVLLKQRSEVKNLEARIEAMETKMDRILQILTEKLTNNAD